MAVRPSAVAALSAAAAPRAGRRHPPQPHRFMPGRPSPVRSHHVRLQPRDTRNIEGIHRPTAAAHRQGDGGRRTRGNALPHPFWLFWILSAILVVVSAVLSGLGVSVVSPSDGETVTVRNLFSGDGLAMAVSTMIDNFASFPPMATIVVVIMGVAVAERSGFLSALMKVGVSRVSASWVVFAVAFAGTVAHVASAAAYIILVPLGGLAFRAVGRSPILGIVVAYTSIASGYDASPVPTPNDAIFAGITTAAAKIVGGKPPTSRP
ncbi:AbgT family transporter [Streptosporangium lutulentum]